MLVFLGLVRTNNVPCKNNDLQYQFLSYNVFVFSLLSPQFHFRLLFQIQLNWSLWLVDRID